MSSTPPLSSSIPGAQQWTTKIAYSQDNHLQTYDIYVPETSPSFLRTWIIYIHGGFFRGVLVHSESFYPAVSLLKGREEYGSSSLGGSGTRWHLRFSATSSTSSRVRGLTFNSMTKEATVASSPARYQAQAYRTAGVFRVLLAPSHGDGLVRWNQLERMNETLDSGGQGYVQTLELLGKHNDIWAHGKDVARAANVLVGSITVSTQNG